MRTGFKGSLVGRVGRFCLMHKLTFITYEVLNVSLHVGPVEPLPGQVNSSLFPKVAHFFMEFFEHLSMEFLW